MKKYPNEGRFKAKSCRTCGKEFTPEAPSHLYCSSECRGYNAYYKRNYGISESEYQKMVETQGSQCYLCGGDGFLMDKGRHKRPLVVDHDHASGAVRKLLCHNCNRALGLLKDNPALMRKCAEYVEAHREGVTTIP